MASGDDPRERRVPVGRLGRLARLAGVGARAGAAILLDGRSPEPARHAAEVLGSLRGLAAKVGQMASYVDGLVPEEHRAVYEGALKGLQAAAPHSSPREVRLLVEEELGGPIDRLFASWDERPFASASIGQVHGAVLPDGTEVAVKVQHPGVARAMENDLRNAGLIESALAMMGTRKLESKELLEEVRARFREELDYGLEAERQVAFAAVHADDEEIRIPKVYLDRCTRRVLTTERVRGLSFDEACAAPEDDRRRWGEALWRFVYKGTLVGGMFNADPHPGNYFFHPGGAVSFVDFGCVQAADEDRRGRGIRLHLAACHRDEAAFRDASRLVLHTRGGAYEARALSYMRLAFEPQFRSPHRITRPYTNELMDAFKALLVDTTTFRLDGAVPLPRGVFFLNRLQFGFYSVMARLDVEVDFAAVERGFLEASRGS